MNAREVVDRLPIADLRDELIGVLGVANRVIVGAPTGSGKTTQLPQYILDSGLAGDRSVVVLQPRRVAARAVARRVCFERGVGLGEEVGYRVRFDDRTSRSTRLVFMTEGVLLRQFQEERDLESVGVLILDEFHERNLYSDVILGLVKHLQQERRPDLKVVVMSATLDIGPVVSYLEAGSTRRSAVLESAGRTFPVDIRYQSRREDRRITDLAAEKVIEVGRTTTEGHILVFMPGMGEINGTIRQLRERRLGSEFEILPMHGELPIEQQDKIFNSTDRRKVIVATNVAESSVTIEGVRYVIDSGLARVARYQLETGFNSLEIEEISQASADQRAGRAGRTGPGVCYRLWTESSQLNRLPQTTPEIQRTELSEIVLQLHALGIKQAETFDWLDAPEVEAVRRAESLLTLLGAFGDDGELSAIGRKMLRLPMNPRFARMLIEGHERGCFDEAALFAALVSGRNLMIRGYRVDPATTRAQETFRDDERSDFFTLQEAFSTVKQGGFRLAECQHYGVNRQVALGVEQVYRQLLHQRDRLGGSPPVANGTESNRKEDILKCLLAGFVDQLSQRRSKGTLECNVFGGREGTLVRESVVQESQWLIATDIRKVSSSKRGGLTLLALASHVEAEWLSEVHPRLVSQRSEYEYDRRQKRVEVLVTERVGDLVLRQEHSKEFDPQASGQCLARAWAEEWLTLSGFDHRVQQFIFRVNLLAHYHPEFEAQPLDRSQQESVIAKALEGERLGKEAQKKPLLPTFKASLSGEQRDWLELLYPESIGWDDGKSRKLVYQLPRKKEAAADIEVVLNLTITECFKLEEHPALGEGKLPVTLIISIPKGKEIARTTNWLEFKQREYPALKSRWQQKYPMVTWA